MAILSAVSRLLIAVSRQPVKHTLKPHYHYHNLPSPAPTKQGIANETMLLHIIRIQLITLLALPAAESLLQYQRLNTHINNYSNSKQHNLQMRLNPTSFKGTDYTITEFPRPGLRLVPNAPIVIFDDQFEAKTQEMLDIMYEAKGVGLAAPQIGLNEDVFVYNPSESKDWARVVCNPIVTKYSEKVIVEEEGCLSLRSDYCAGQVARSTWIEVQYQNELGQNVRRRLKGFEARVFQHEYDHLKGILCYDRFPPEDREAVQKSIEYLLEMYPDDDAQIEPDAEEAKAMQPRPLSAKFMPPLQLEEVEVDLDPKKATKPSGGFGMGKSKNTGKKKEKKKKVKVRNAARSDNPKFKSSGKTAYANPK